MPTRLIWVAIPCHSRIPVLAHDASPPKDCYNAVWIKSLEDMAVSVPRNNTSKVRFLAKASLVFFKSVTHLVMAPLFSTAHRRAIALCVIVSAPLQHM